MWILRSKNRGNLLNRRKNLIIAVLLLLVMILLIVVFKLGSKAPQLSVVEVQRLPQAIRLQVQEGANSPTHEFSIANASVITFDVNVKQGKVTAEIQDFDRNVTEKLSFPESAMGQGLILKPGDYAIRFLYEDFIGDVAVRWDDVKNAPNIVLEGDFREAPDYWQNAG